MHNSCRECLVTECSHDCLHWAALGKHEGGACRCHFGRLHLLWCYHLRVEGVDACGFEGCEDVLLCKCLQEGGSPDLQEIFFVDTSSMHVFKLTDFFFPDLFEFGKVPRPSSQHITGQKYPKVLDQEGGNEEVFEELLNEQAFQRISGFTSG